MFHNIHALPFEARPRENAIDGYLVDFVVKTLCEKLSTLERDVVAYKGGTLEKQLLTRLNIPHVDLEEYGCPKPNRLLFMDSNLFLIAVITFIPIPTAHE